MNALFAVLFHGIGGLAAGSFYVPFRRVREWAWESYWLVNGVFAWLVMPWLVVLAVVPHWERLVQAAPANVLIACFGFGLLWGIGGLTFGMAMRYLGVSLGMAVALGFCAAFGTLVPMLQQGQFSQIVAKASGLATLGGVALCVIGIAMCGQAGMLKERELSPSQQRATVAEFHLGRGLMVAVVSGLLSACFAFGLAAGKPLAGLALAQGTPNLWQNSVALVFIMGGGFTTNLLWCTFLHIRNSTSGDYIDLAKPLANNYMFSALAGVIWYSQFMFYGFGSTFLGPYDFAGWSLHMAFIIVFSTLWGLRLGEWRGCGRRTLKRLAAGLALVVLSTMVIGLAAKLG